MTPVRYTDLSPNPDARAEAARFFDELAGTLATLADVGWAPLSVSVGDGIELDGTFHWVAGVGFEELRPRVDWPVGPD